MQHHLAPPAAGARHICLCSLVLSETSLADVAHMHCTSTVVTAQLTAELGVNQLTVMFYYHVLTAHLYRGDDNGGGRHRQRSRSHSKTPGGGSSGDRHKRERQVRHRSPSHEEEGQITDRYSSHSMHPPFPKCNFLFLLSMSV